MKLLRRLLLAGVAVTILVVVVLSILWVRSTPTPLPAGSESAARLAAGPWAVGAADLRWVDASRPTAANGDYPGSAERSLAVTIWYPKGAAGPHPLAVYCHGFVSERRAGSYLAEHLASHGYVVLAADFPLTNMRSPGGPVSDDVVNQPGDVSFLIDQVLALAGDEKPFPGAIDVDRVAVFGLSLGGTTATLVGFHPEWRDRRVGTVLSLAGASDVFGQGFFANADVPFLMVAGTADSIVDYQTNALPMPDRIRDGGLVTLAGGTHLGFADFSSGPLRLLGNPDELACRVAADESELEHPFNGLFGTPDEGFLVVEAYVQPCRLDPQEIMRPGRQQDLTTVIARAFFDSSLARDPDERAASHEFLTRTLPSEIAEVTLSFPSPSRERARALLSKGNRPLREDTS